MENPQRRQRSWRYDERRHLDGDAGRWAFSSERRPGIISETHAPDEVFAEAREHFTEVELVSLTMAVIAINGWNRLAISFRLLAERAVTLGAAAEGTTRQSAANSTIGEYDLGAVDGLDHVRALAGQLAKLAASIRNAIQQSAELGDPTTADLFTEISRSLDKDLWFPEAHLQKSR